MTDFSISGPLPAARTALEASAGTGKTWTIAALATRFVAEGHARLDELLIVTFTRAATSELRSRVRDRLLEASRHLHSGGATPTTDPLLIHLATGSPAELHERATRLDVAVRSFDAASITTIHGFCQRVLSAAGYAGDVGGRVDLVENVDTMIDHHVRDLLVGFFHDQPLGDKKDLPGEQTATAALTTALANPGITIRPDGSGNPDEPVAARALSQIAAAGAPSVGHQKRRLGVSTFDDLLVRLEAALRDEHAADTIRTAMDAAFRVAMIDEFQDTDPTQWSLLEALFGTRPLILIGDPKQAIYAFRGADVQAYVQAVNTAGTTSATLGTNHRSDGRLIDALNILFQGVEFGDAGITYQRVGAANTDDRLHYPAGTRPPLQIRAVTDRALKAEAARDIIALDLVAQIDELLDSGATIAREDTTARPVEAGDCAVLVRSNSQAQTIKGALVDAGIHAVINGVGSVLDSDAAADWSLLLDAIGRPSSSVRVRAVALTHILGRTPESLAAMTPVDEAALHDRFHGWAQVLADHGVAALNRTVAASTGLHGRVLREVGGDRWLADFEHIAELLHGFAGGQPMSPAVLRGWLTVEAEEDEAVPSDQLARRLESDARAVQILTIHRSKGLEFPVVYAPFVSALGIYPRVPHLVRLGGQRILDLGSTGVREAKEAADEDWYGEHLRLLYVALTRAKHRLVVWWWPNTREGHKVAFTKVLFAADPDDGGPRVGARPINKIDEAAQQAGLDALNVRLGDVGEVVEVSDPPVIQREWASTVEAGVELSARRFGGEIDWRWQRASYSSLTKPKPSSTLVPLTPDDVDAVEDESETVPTGSGVPDGDDLPLPLGDQPAGAAFGTLLHTVLEHTDFAAADLVAEITGQVEQFIPGGGVTIEDEVGLAAGLVEACQTPMGSLFGDRPLAGIERADRLDEMTFELPVGHGGSHVSLASIADVLTPYAGSGPLVGYPARLRDRTPVNRVRGFLTGSIDLVWRRWTDDGPVFHVIDHKSNRLYGYDEQGSTWHYRPAALTETMQHSHYLLQALLYRVALHRYLRWRQPDYDPTRHLGAVGYTFLRGMVGIDTPAEDGHRYGVFSWLPPVGLTEELSELLETGR